MPAAASPRAAPPSKRTCSSLITRAAISRLPPSFLGIAAEAATLTSYAAVLTFPVRRRGLR